MATPKLYGREAEVGALDELSHMIHVRGGAVVVRGEAGLGKSALQEFEGPHLLPAKDGWEEVADYALTWALDHAMEREPAPR